MIFINFGNSAGTSGWNFEHIYTIFQPEQFNVISEYSSQSQSQIQSSFIPVETVLRGRHIIYGLLKTGGHFPGGLQCQFQSSPAFN